MKATLALALAFALPLAAEDSKPAVASEASDSRQVRFDLLIVSVPEARALELRAQLQDPAKIAAAQEKLLALVASKEGELVGWPTVTTKSGGRCVIETIRELLFPSEFRTAALTVNLGGENPATVATPEAPKLPDKLPKIEADITTHGGVPSSFTKRDLGVTFEAEPTIGADGMTVRMQLAPQHVQLLGFRKVPFEQDDGKIKSVVEQPEIAACKVSTTMTVKSGVPVMLGFHKVEKPAGNVEIFILETTVEKIPR